MLTEELIHYFYKSIAHGHMLLSQFQLAIVVLTCSTHHKIVLIILLLAATLTLCVHITQLL